MFVRGEWTDVSVTFPLYRVRRYDDGQEVYEKITSATACEQIHKRNGRYIRHVTDKQPCWADTSEDRLNGTGSFALTSTEFDDEKTASGY